MLGAILSSSVRGVVRGLGTLRVRVERVKESMAPGILGLEKACQGNPSKAQHCCSCIILTWKTHSIEFGLGLGLGLGLG